MASFANPNQQPQPIPTFDMQRFFKPTNPSPPQPPNPPNLNISPPFSPPSGPYSYSPQSASFQPSPYHHYPYHPQPQNATLHHQRSLSYPTPPLQPPISSPTNPNPNSEARLMALLNPNQPPPPAPPNPPSSSSSLAIMNLMPPPPIRMPSSKLPKGRHLGGDRVVYDVDVRLEGETQPQLEVTPITKYQSDPHLVFGRQIAHNKGTAEERD